MKAPRNRRLWQKTLLSFFVSAVLFAFFLAKADLSEMIRSMKGVDPLFVLFAFSSHYASYFVRGIRWKRMVRREGFSGGTADLAKIIFLFQSLNCVLPAKLGDLYGAHLMKINFALSRSFALGSLFLWRVFDFVMVVTLAMGTAVLLFGNRIPRELFWTMKVVGPGLLSLLILMWLFYHYHRRFPLVGRFERLKGLLEPFREGIRMRWNDVPFLLITTTAIWFLEAGRFFLICKATRLDLQWLPVIFITSSAAFLTILPLTPSGLGAVELSMLTLLDYLGVGSQAAFPPIIWDRMIAHWSQVLLGIILLLFGGTIQLKVWEFEEEKQGTSRGGGGPSASRPSSSP